MARSMTRFVGAHAAPPSHTRLISRQILALLYYAYLQWPRRVQRLWFAFTLANFNVEVMRAECSMEIFRNYNTKWLLQASLPILFAVICLITVLIISCHACTVARNEDRLRRCCPSAYAPRPSRSGNTSGRGYGGRDGFGWAVGVWVRFATYHHLQ